MASIQIPTFLADENFVGSVARKSTVRIIEGWRCVLP
jgi:hypothetical protein